MCLRLLAILCIYVLCKAEDVLEEADHESPCENLSQGDPLTWTECLGSGSMPTGLKQQLLNIGGEEAVVKVTGELDKFRECFKSNFNISSIKEEMEEAETEGAVDVVFKKYCDRSPAFNECLRPVTEAFRQYLKEQEKINLDHIQAAINKSIDFICHHDGDRIALFMSEDGFQCLSDHHEELLACNSDIFGEQNPPATTSDAFDLISFDPDSCRKYNQFRECFTGALQKCSDPTPANLADSLMREALTATPCGEKQPGSTSSLVASAFLIFIVSVLV